MTEFKAGDKIRLIKMGDDPTPIPPGATGTIQHYTIFGLGAIITVKWDPPNESRALNLCYPEDWFEVI